MAILEKIADFLRGNNGVGSTPISEPLQEGHELVLEETFTEEDAELQTTMNEDSIESLNEEDTVVENVDAKEEE